MPIRRVLIAGVIGLQFLSAAAIVGSSYWSSQKVLLNHARQIMDNVVDNTIEHLTDFLEPARTATDLTQKLAQHEVLRSDDVKGMERYLFEQLFLNSQFSGIYFGSIDGDFFYVSRNDDIEPGGFKTKIILRDLDATETTNLWRDDSYNLIQQERDPTDKFDPRSRPWYKKAQNAESVVWTEPYVFFTSKEPGITSASTVHGKDGLARGVVGVDIEISDISIFLARLSEQTKSTAFILNANGDIIAHPNFQEFQPALQNPSDVPKLLHIDQLVNRPGQAAFASLELSDDIYQTKDLVFTTFKWQDETYHAIFTPFPNSDWTWTIGVYVREDDFLGAIKKNQVFNIAVAGFITLFACLLGLFFARGIARPIAALSQAASTVRGGSLDAIKTIETPFIEIQEANATFGEMVDSLKKKEEKNRTLTSGLRKANEVLESRVEQRTKDLQEEVVERKSIEEQLRQSYELLEERIRERTSELVNRNQQLVGEIAERKRIELALTESQSRLGAIIDNSPDMIILKDLDGHYLEVNKGFEHHYGRKHEDIIGKTVNELEPPDLARSLTDHEQEVLRLAQPVTREVTFHRNGEEKTFISTRFPIPDADGNTVLIGAIDHDISIRKAAEIRLLDREARLRELQSELQHVSRLSAVGELSSALAHELNQPLAAIVNYVQAIQAIVKRQDGKVTQKVFDLIDKSVVQADRASAVIRGLRAFIEKRESLFSDEDIRQLVEEACALGMVGTSTKGITLNLEFEADLPKVRVDRLQIQQVIINLVRNAIEAMEQVDERVLTISAMEEKDLFIEVTVTDTGPGVDKDAESSIFEPFVTTKSNGIGIGLSISKSIIEANDGRLWVERSPAGGASFHLTLPVAKPEEI